MGANKSRRDRQRALSPEAIKVAFEWDSLPLVAQQHVLDVIETQRRLSQHALAPKLFARADPQRVRAHERKIEAYQTLNRARRKRG
jgi:hypothetical protein